MNTPFAVVATSALLAATLSGCSLQVRDAEPEVAPNPSAAASPSASNPGTTVKVPGLPGLDGEFGESECSGEDISIDETASVVVLTGSCGKLTVGASDVVVTVDSTTGLTVTGDRVTVVVTDDAAAVTLSGSNGFLTVGSASSISVGGSGNTVAAEIAGGMTISGSNNYIAWSDGASSASDTGTGNTVVGP
jgi:Protein of unknown function (DUF3060)